MRVLGEQAHQAGEAQREHRQAQQCDVVLLAAVARRGLQRGSRAQRVDGDESGLIQRRELVADVPAGAGQVPVGRPSVSVSGRHDGLDPGCRASAGLVAAAQPVHGEQAEQQRQEPEHSGALLARPAHDAAAPASSAGPSAVGAGSARLARFGWYPRRLVAPASARAVLPQRTNEQPAPGVPARSAEHLALGTAAAGPALVTGTEPRQRVLHETPGGFSPCRRRRWSGAWSGTSAGRRGAGARRRRPTARGRRPETRRRPRPGSTRWWSCARRWKDCSGC